MRLKRLERAWRRACIATVARFLGPAEVGARPQWSPGPHRVLFLRHDRIGDMILSTGLLRAIATAQPTVALDVLASPANAPVLSAQEGIAAVIRFDKRKPWTYPGLVRRLRAAKYDAVMDCMVTAPSLTTLLLMLASGARHRIGVQTLGNGFAYTVPVPPNPEARHLVEHLAALGTAFGIDAQSADWRPRIQLTDGEQQAAERTWQLRAAARRGRRLLVNVSAGKAFRQWPDDRFITVLRHVHTLAPEVAMMVIGAPGDAERVARIAREGGAVEVATPGIRDAFGLVATADVVFTPDTSIGHAASAFGVPAVVLHIAGTAERWGLYGTRGHHVSSADATLAAIPVEPVLSALDDLVLSIVSIRPAPAGVATPRAFREVAAAPVERDAGA